MTVYRLFCLSIVPLLLFFACKSSSKNQQPPIGDNSQTSLDWPGVYTGVLPCADCAGIQSTLFLDTNQTYTLLRQYQGKPGKELTYSGNFTWNKTGSEIQLEAPDKARFKVGENRLLVLDQEGKVVEGELASRYQLQKDLSGLLEYVWTLNYLDGLSRQPAGASRTREPAIRLRAIENRILVTGPCNNFTGSFVVNTEGRIRPGPLAGTRRACPDMETETLFIQALEKVKAYQVSGNQLTLSGEAGQELARFTRGLPPENGNREK